ncbi:hypothetical protein BGZ73_007319 [Actinomortierella ambigua]|nr:hypothetical protein BGZ73_007319 [Actinomortierella ambigua]
MMAVDLPKPSLWRNYSFHGLDLVLVVIEVAINAMPFVPSHLVIVIFVAILYLAEAFVVHAVDGIWMYPFLDTSNRLWALFYAGVGCVIIAAFAAMYYIHRLKDWLMHCRHSSQHVLTLTNKSELASQKTDLDECGLGGSEFTLDIDGNSKAQQQAVTKQAMEEEMVEPNRKRSDSNTSVASSAMTLVGDCDERCKEEDEKSDIQQDTHHQGSIPDSNSTPAEDSTEYTPVSPTESSAQCIYRPREPKDDSQNHPSEVVVEVDQPQDSVRSTMPPSTTELSSESPCAIASTLSNSGIATTHTYLPSRLEKITEEDEGQVRRA